MASDPDEHAFVIKLYPDEGRRLRGHITHAYSHRRQPIRQPEDVLAFLAPYLASMDVRLQPRSRFLLWMSGLRAPADPPDTAPSVPE